MRANTAIWGLVAFLCAAGAYGGFKVGSRGGAVAAGEESRGDRPARSGKAQAVRTKGRIRLDPASVAGVLREAVQRRDEEAWAAAHEALPDMGKESLVVVLGELAGADNLRAREELMRPVLRALAKLDPALALEQANTHLDGHWLIQAEAFVLAQWAEVDPVSALRYVDRRSGAPSAGNLYTSIFHVWARHDYQGAANAYGQLEGEDARNSAMQALARAAGERPDLRVNLMEPAAIFASRARQEEFVADAVGRWAMDGSLQEIERWIDEQEVGSEFAARLRRSVAEGMGYSNPKRTAEWLMSRSTPESRSRDLEAIVTTWVNSQPHACGEWLETQATGPHADRAVSAYSLRIAPRAPREAIGWALRIHDSELQRRSFERIVEAMGPIPAERVQSELEKAGLPAPLAIELLEKREER